MSQNLEYLKLEARASISAVPRPATLQNAWPAGRVLIAISVQFFVAGRDGWENVKGAEEKGAMPRKGRLKTSVDSIHEAT